MKFSYDRTKVANVLLILILGLSLFFRVLKLDKIPPSLNWDEISHGFNAYSVLKTGADEWGSKFPLIFRAYGDYKLPLYVYLTAISEAIFTLSPYSVRLVSVLSGVGLVLVTYLITRRLTSNRKISLLACFLTAVSPWSLFVSRIGVEANLGAFLFATGMYFFILWEENPERKNLLFFSVFLGLSMYSYNSARIIAPLSFIIMAIEVLRKKRFKQLYLPFVIFLIFSLPIALQIYNKSGIARFDLVSLINQGTINRIIQKRQESKLPQLLTKLIFNRPTFFITYAIKNYLSNFSPKYLFFYGGSHYQFSQPDHELLYLVTAPFLLIGLVKALFGKKSGEKAIVWWFFLAFIPSAITKDAPHVLRSIFVLPMPMILSVLGVEWVTKKIKSGGNLVTFALVVSVGVSFFFWWQDYNKIYPVAYSWAWQYGYSQAVSFVKQNYEKYDQIFFTKRYGEPHEFVLFYFPWDPAKYLDDKNKKWNYHAGWYWVDRFDKFVFINDWEVEENAKCNPFAPSITLGISPLRTKVQSAKCLLVTSPGNYPDGWNKIETIKFLDGKTAFEILEN